MVVLRPTHENLLYSFPRRRRCRRTRHGLRHETRRFLLWKARCGLLRDQEGLLLFQEHLLGQRQLLRQGRLWRFRSQEEQQLIAGRNAP